MIDDMTPVMPDLHLAYPRTPTEFRKTLGHLLALGTVGGERWVTNRYFLTPAQRFATVIGDLEDGCYLPDGNGWASNGRECPPVERFLNLDDYAEPVEVTQVDGRIALVASYIRPEKVADEVIIAPFCKAAGLNARYLRLLTHLDPLNTSVYGDQLSNIRLRTSGAGGLKPVGVFADVTQRRGGHRDTTTDKYRFIPETFEPAGERLIGVLMPVRLG